VIDIDVKKLVSQELTVTELSQEPELNKHLLNMVDIVFEFYCLFAFTKKQNFIVIVV